MSKKIVFLDRDGVINKLVDRDGRLVSPRLFDDFEILPGVSLALGKLREFGFEIVVVTNQPDISRGLMEIQEFEKMNQLVCSLGVNEIRFCPHSNEDCCECRKPKSGLLTSHLAKMNEQISELWMIGDNESDMECGIGAGARTILISEKISMKTMAEHVEANLDRAVKYLLAKALK